MWLIWKKIIGYILVLAAASFFGYELLPNKGGGMRELPSVNEEMRQLIVSSGNMEGTAQHETPVTTVTPKPAAESSSPTPAPSAEPNPALSATGSPPPESAVSASPSSSGRGKINVNKAGVVELTELPDIGESKARAILDYRAKHGPFRSVEELDNVKGIGAKTVEKLRPLVTF